MKEEIKLLKALADETRMRILQCVLNGEQCACAIVPFAGRAQPTVSQHLRILEGAGVLGSRRQGVNIWYSLKSKTALEILNALGIEKARLDPTISCQ